MEVPTLGILAPDPRSPAEARRLVRAALAGTMASDALDQVLLAVSELATNAVEHAATAFEVRVIVLDGVVRVEIADGSDVQPVGGADPGPSAVTGRGLLLVGRIADRWGVEPERGGKVVWFERALERG